MRFLRLADIVYIFHFLRFMVTEFGGEKNHSKRDFHEIFSDWWIEFETNYGEREKKPATHSTLLNR